VSTFRTPSSLSFATGGQDGIMHESNFALRDNNGIDELTLDLALAKLLLEKRFSKIVRFVRWQQKKPASGSAEQIRRDIRLCELLTEYESQSEIVGMIDLMRDLKKRSSQEAVRKGRIARGRKSA
jgi:hypothetical protein